MHKNSNTSDGPKTFDQLGDADLMSMFRAVTAVVAKRGLLGGAKAKEVGVEAIEALRSIITRDPRVAVDGQFHYTIAEMVEAEKLRFEAIKLALIANGEIAGIGV